MYSAAVAHNGPACPGYLWAKGLLACDPSHPPVAAPSCSVNHINDSKTTDTRQLAVSCERHNGLTALKVAQCEVTTPLTGCWLRPLKPSCFGGEAGGLYWCCGDNNAVHVCGTEQHSFSDPTEPEHLGGGTESRLSSPSDAGGGERYGRRLTISQCHYELDSFSFL